MKIEPVLIGEYGYTYVLLCEETSEAAIVDPGSSAEVIAKLEALGAKPTAILCTNHHADRCAGNAELLERYPELKIYAHSSESERTPGVTDPIDDQEPVGGWREGQAPLYIPDLEIAVGKLAVKVMHTPGHTTGGLCYVVEDAVFTGDVMLGGGTNRNFESNVDVLMRSLNDKLSKLPPRTKVYPAREWTERNLEFALKVDPTNEALRSRLQAVRDLRKEGRPTVPSTIADELATNPFIRIEDRALHDHVLGEYFEPDEPFYVFSRLLQMRERALGSPAASETGPQKPAAHGDWEEKPAWDRYEYHLDWRRNWKYWLELPDLERRRAVHDPAFWDVLTEDQRKNFLIEADWQELRHVKGDGEQQRARETKLEGLASLEQVCEHLGLDHVQVYWLMSTRKLPGWLVGGVWKFDLGQIDRFVEDFGGRETLRKDIEDQIAKHRAAQQAPSQQSG